ncbi:MAG: aminotransferase [Bacteroidota bacterium]|nr:aminotransferase [Bacteroidota bacterium]
MKIKDFGVETWINRYEKDCTYNLTETCVGTLTIDELLELSGNSDEIINEIKNMKMGYGDIFGSSRLRNLISGLYNTAEDNNISITHGAIGANALTMLTLVEQGDKVITILPIYQQHYSIPESIGANVTTLYLKEERNWLPDLDEIRRNATPDTKLICINNPNNPTGSVMSEEFLKEIVNIAKECDAYLLCDEAYRGLTHEGENFTTSVFDLYDKAISTGSMSKTFSLPGLRLGWVVGPTDFIEKINHQRNYHVISIGRINDYLASIALENKDKIVKRNIKICRTNAKMLDEWVMGEKHIDYIKPTGGTTAFLKFDLNMTSAELCLRLQKETGVMFLPGSVLEMEGYLRIGYTGDINNIHKALTTFSGWLNQF